MARLEAEAIAKLSVLDVVNADNCSSSRLEVGSLHVRQAHYQQIKKPSVEKHRDASARG